MERYRQLPLDIPATRDVSLPQSAYTDDFWEEYRLECDIRQRDDLPFVPLNEFAGQKVAKDLITALTIGRHPWELPKRGAHE